MKKALTKETFMHIVTGAIDSREGWIASYDTDELTARGLTASEAFDEDDGTTLIQQ